MGILDSQSEAKINNLLSVPQNVEAPIAETHGDFFKFRLDNTDILEEIEHQLRGEVFSNGKWEKKFDSDLNDNGVKEIINMIYSLGINKNMILGCLTHEEIYSRCNSTWKEISKFFVTDGYRLGLDKNKRGILTKKIVYLIHSSLSRSEEGRESGQISTASQRVEHFLKEDKQKENRIKIPFLGRN